MKKKKVARTMQPSIRIALMSIEMSSSISSCTFGCTCTHRQHGAEAPRTAAAAAAASKAQRRCRLSRSSVSCSWAPGARKSHLKCFPWPPAAPTRRAQQQRRPPLLYPLSHVLYDNVAVEAAAPCCARCMPRARHDARKHRCDETKDTESNTHLDSSLLDIACVCERR